MKVFHNEFKNCIKGIFVCSWRGHKIIRTEECWAIAHSTGRILYVCKRCNKIDKIEGRKFPDELTSL